jgi:hypothetical protein
MSFESSLDVNGLATVTGGIATGDIHINDDVSGPNNITGVDTLEAQTVDATTVNAETVNATTLNAGDTSGTAGTVNVTDGTSNTIILDGSTGDITTTGDVIVSGSITADGGMTVTGGLDNSGDGITNAGAISGVTTLETSGDVTIGGGLDVSGATSLGSTLSVTGLSSLDGGIDVNGGNFTVATNGDTSIGGTLGVTGNLTAEGTTNIIGTEGVSDNTLTGATNTITGTTNTSITGGNAGINLEDNVASIGVSGGAEVIATNNQVTVLTADGKGLTVDQTSHTTTLTGGTNSSSLELADEYATISVGTATTAEVDVIHATNTDGATSIIIGGSSNVSNQILSTASGGTNYMTANATDGENIISAATNTIEGETTISSGGNSIAVEGGASNNSITVGDTQQGEVGVNTFDYGTHVSGGMLVDGDLGVNGSIYSLNPTASATVNVGNNGLTIVGEQNTVFLQADDDSLETNARAHLTMTPDTANLYVNTDEGVPHGVAITQDSTVVSGGTSSTSLTLDDDGATFQNDDTGGPAKVTGVADGVDRYDAVNMGQFSSAVRRLDKRIDKAYSGIASVAALSSIPNPTPGKNFSVGLGFGNFENESAIAVGGKALIGKNKNITLTGGVGISGNTTTMSAGVGWSF